MLKNYVIYKNKYLYYISGYMTLVILFLLSERYHIVLRANIFTLNRTDRRSQP